MVKWHGSTAVGSPSRSINARFFIRILGGANQAAQLHRRAAEASWSCQRWLKAWKRSGCSFDRRRPADSKTRRVSPSLSVPTNGGGWVLVSRLAMVGPRHRVGDKLEVCIVRGATVRYCNCATLAVRCLCLVGIQPPGHATERAAGRLHLKKLGP